MKALKLKLSDFEMTTTYYLDSYLYMKHYNEAYLKVEIEEKEENYSHYYRGYLFINGQLVYDYRREFEPELVLKQINHDIAQLFNAVKGESDER